MSVVNTRGLTALSTLKILLLISISLCFLAHLAYPIFASISHLLIHILPLTASLFFCLLPFFLSLVFLNPTLANFVSLLLISLQLLSSSMPTILILTSPQSPSSNWPSSFNSIIITSLKAARKVFSVTNTSSLYSVNPTK